ncbi:MAG: deoxyhypusine synthase family protein, partial [Oligoflexia bacterium]|nr:deoxyhypusine synthase family protein [Oligoflexia bacterium]
MNNLSDFINTYFCRFNSAQLRKSAEAYKNHIARGGKMVVTLSGAMSTGEIGKILSPMILNEKVHVISCTGANLEEDIFNLISHKSYREIPDYKDLSPKQEEELYKNGYNRVTDVCIPESAFCKLEELVFKYWEKASREKKRYFPHEYIYKTIQNRDIEDYYQINPEDSWVIAAIKKQIPIIVPGWEDSTLGNKFVSHCMKGKLEIDIIKNGLEYMLQFANWYQKESQKSQIGFFQIGGGIAGDFPICVVPMLNQDLGKNVPLWSYFCQVSDSTTSYGSYSGAVPNEKVTWGKLETSSPKYMIESDASIVV